MTYKHYLQAIGAPTGAVCGGDGLTEHEPPPEVLPKPAHDPDMREGTLLFCLTCGTDYTYERERDGYLCSEPWDCPACEVPECPACREGIKRHG